MVRVDEGPHHRRDSLRPFQIEDMVAYTEESEQPVERFEGSHDEDDNDQLLDNPESILGKPPMEEEQEEPRQNHPFKKLDLCCVREKTERDDLQWPAPDLQLMAEFIGLWGNEIDHPSWKRNRLKQDEAKKQEQEEKGHSW